jgi:hypothetical protein
MILQLYYSDFRETINFSIHLNFLFLNFCHYTMYCFRIADFKYFKIAEQSFLLAFSCLCWIKCFDQHVANFIAFLHY